MSFNINQNSNHDYCFAVAIDLIVQHIRDFLNNRSKQEQSQSETTSNSGQSPTPNAHPPARRVNSNEGHRLH